MTTPLLQLTSDERAVELRHDEGLLLRYVYRPDTPADESPRPYAHPVCSLAGEVLTNFRPNDHRWHHGLGFTITRVSGYNFWGGVTYEKDDGYQWRGDHGVQLHREWQELSPHRIAHSLDWKTAPDGECLLRENRVIECAIESPDSWHLRWSAVLTNVTTRTLELGQYHSNQGLKGSHYSGLQFRGARELLDDHGDASMGVACDGDLEGESNVHGASSMWMEWRCQKDVTQRRVKIRFENHTGPTHCFVRRALPLAAIPFQYEHDLPLGPGGMLKIDCSIQFVDQ